MQSNRARGICLGIVAWLVAAVSVATAGEIKITKRYLLLPIDEDGRGASVALVVDGREVRYLGMRLAVAEHQIDWWAFLHVAEYKGKTATLRVTGLSNAEMKLIRQADRVPGEEKWGDEQTRPQFHFSQKVGWNNDPNGMVYYDGEWHLCFQHNPVGRGHGNMTWGHAVSTDLVHWKQLPSALHHRRGDAMFSGGAAVDWKNTGGWKTGKNDVIIVTWTSTGRGECIAYSNDKGRTFTEYKGNPIIRHGGRDPKPIWYTYDKADKPLSDAAKKLGGHWVIAVYDGHGGANIAFYTSTNLKKWTFRSRLYGYYECAELFPLPVDGDKKNMRWVIFAADARYAIGRFDGRKFTPEHRGKHQLHWGPYYASQLFSDAPDGRRIQIGWATLGMGDAPFNQTFTFPTELTLRSTPDGIRMFGEPVKEIEKIHGRTRKARNKPLADGRPVKLDVSGSLFDIRAVFEVGTAKQVGLLMDGTEVFSYDAAARRFMGHPLKPVDGKVSVQLLVDRPLIETFVNDGRMVVTAPNRGGRGTRLDLYTARNGATRGVNYAYFEGEWNKLPDFGKLTPVKTGAVDYFDISPRKRDDKFGFRFTGFVKIKKKGQYAFITTSDDGSRLYIGDKLVVDNDGLHASRRWHGEIKLEAGMHPITVDFFERGGGEALRVGYAVSGEDRRAVESVTAFARGGKAKLVSLKVHELKASWK
jgi:fructan beta-fructosidase